MGISLVTTVVHHGYKHGINCVRNHRLNRGLQTTISIVFVQVRSAKDDVRYTADERTTTQLSTVRVRQTVLDCVLTKDLENTFGTTVSNHGVRRQ